MSDLLTRMIARASRTTAGVMPVVPSRYEASYPSLGVFEETAEPPAHGRGEAGQPPLAAPAEIARPRLIESMGSEPAMDRSEGPKKGVVVAHTARVRLPPADPKPGGTQPNEPARASLPQAKTGESWPEPPAHNQTDVPAEAALSANNPPGEIEIRQHQSSSAALAGRWPREDSPRSRRDFGTRDTEPGQPVEVHVSIGHIEVRQATPPSPPSPRPAPVPHVLLGDYLKRRSGDAR